MNSHKRISRGYSDIGSRAKRVKSNNKFLPLRGLVRREGLDPGNYEYEIEWRGRPIDYMMAPRGLENSSTDCYRNSAWQALLAVPAVVNWLQDNHAPLEDGRPKCSKSDCPGCEFQGIYECVYPENPDITFDPEDQLVFTRGADMFFARRDIPGMRPWDKIWTEEGYAIGTRCGSEDVGEYLTFMQETLCNRGMRRSMREAKTLFGPEIEFRIHCSANSEHSAPRDPPSPTRAKPTIKEFEIHLNTVKDHRGRLALEELIGEKWYGGDSQFHRCAECGARGEGAVTGQIDFPTHALFMKLDRWTWGGDKVTDDVEFPEILDLSQYLNKDAIDDGQTAVYRLASIIFHSGSVDFGHYRAVVRGPTGRWQDLNDSRSTDWGTIDDILAQRKGPLDLGFVPVVFGYVKAAPIQEFVTPIGSPTVSGPQRSVEDNRPGPNSDEDVPEWARDDQARQPQWEGYEEYHDAPQYFSASDEQTREDEFRQGQERLSAKYLQRHASRSRTRRSRRGEGSLFFTQDPYWSPSHSGPRPTHMDARRQRMIRNHASTPRRPTRKYRFGPARSLFRDQEPWY